MFHRLLSTDGPGTECYACGQAWDYSFGDGKESWVPCYGPQDTLPHHWIDLGGHLDCGYCVARVTEHTLPADIPPECVDR